ncbi:hypothetical protein PR048_024629 [Dryococelus australis]|uniref:Strictosidine synthase conserved region domain-containing protein n=1 Tax=Dryococelus australis TaxID=614101 RepID=A0ABQ9GP68_9NEOP|nr:hypothetical protein PR048_024629 [Dryococelus australis]
MSARCKRGGRIYPLRSNIWPWALSSIKPYSESFADVATLCLPADNAPVNFGNTTQCTNIGHWDYVDWRVHKLFQYNPITNTSKMLIDKIQFANGVILSPEEDFVLVAETGKSRILRLMSGLLGNVEQFAVSNPYSWDSCAERLNLYLQANYVTDADKKCAVLLSVCGPKS